MSEAFLWGDAIQRQGENFKLDMRQVNATHPLLMLSTVLRRSG
jgi:hypothetical protein